jgi:hypothetical protein
MCGWHWGTTDPKHASIISHGLDSQPPMGRTRDLLGASVYVGAYIYIYIYIYIYLQCLGKDTEESSFFWFVGGGGTQVKNVKMNWTRSSDGRK